MKSKTQKQNELDRGRTLFDASKSLIFVDFSRVTAEDFRKLRHELHGLGVKILVLKKRLLGVLLKERGIETNAKEIGPSVATIFSPASLEEVSGPVYAFFKTLGKGLEKEKILGGVDPVAKALIPAQQVQMIGQLPPREVLLGQLLGMLASPIRSFLYVLQEKSKKSN